MSRCTTPCRCAWASASVTSPQDSRRLRDRNALRRSAQPVAQRLPVDERHDVIQQAVRRPRVDQGEDVRMLELRRDGDLAQEPVGADGGGEIGVQNLDRDRTVVPQVAREVHHRHPAVADLALHVVPARECRAKPLERVGHVLRVHGRTESRRTVARGGRQSSESLGPADRARKSAPARRPTPWARTPRRTAPCAAAPRPRATA